MKPFLLLVPALAAALAACASPEPETRYVIIREQVVDRELAVGATDYCRQRGLNAVVVEDESGDDRVTFYCR